MNEAASVPRSFWIVAILLLLWALMGDFAYVSQASRAVPMDAYDAALFDAMPGWVWGAYALAVWVGTAGAIALLLRRKIAAALFAVSLIAVVVQFGYTLGMTDLIAVKGLATAAGFPLVIFAIGLFQLWWARRCAAQGRLR